MLGSNKRDVSRERVIGISFVDILIQVTFLLLLALMVGYVDPNEKDELTSVGRDACNKINRQSTKPCSEVLPQFIDQLSTRCKELGATSAADCMDRLKAASVALQAAEKSGNVSFCLKTSSQLKRPPPSVRFKIAGPGKIYFGEFDPAYIDYLTSQSQVEKLRLVETIKNDPQRVYTASEIPKVFGFVSESTCLMRVFARKVGSFSDDQIANELAAVYDLPKPIKRK